MKQLLKLILKRASGDREWKPSIDILREAWPGLVGEKIGALTRPAEIDWKEGRLAIEAATENWRHELRRHDDELLERLNEVLPWRIETLEVRLAEFVDPEVTAAEQTRPRSRAADDTSGSTRRTDESPGSRRAEVPEDLDESLESLGEGTADTARRILEHVREED